MTRILLDDGLLEVAGYWMNKFIGRVKLALPFYCFPIYFEHLFQCLLPALNLE